jgi:DNA modification methylase
MQTSLFDYKVAAEQISAYRHRLEKLLRDDLDFHGQNSTYSSHAIHAFPAKFPPQLPKKIIENLTEPGDLVLDPMMGSGTTLLEAVLLNRCAIGVDIDPLALRISYTKLNPKSLGVIEECGFQVAEKAEKRVEKDPLELIALLGSSFDSETQNFINYWFLPETQIELMALLDEIRNVQDQSVKSFLLLNFSAIIITKSGGVSLALDLAHTRPHRETSKKVRSSFDEFRKRLKRNLQNISSFDLPKANFVTAEGNIERLPLANSSVDLIVTSPPYASHAIDYMRAHKFSLVWLGFPISELVGLRRNYIGGDAINGFKFLPLPIFVQTTVKAIEKLDIKKAQVLHRYYSEMTTALQEMYRVIKPGKAVVLVVGNSIMRGINTETDRCLGEIGKEIGFDLVQIGIRNLDRNKRMLPARKNDNEHKSSQIEERMHHEYVLGLLKPET